MNEITSFGKLFAGILLIIGLSISSICLIGVWPDAIPLNDTAANYDFRLFHVRLITSTPLFENEKSQDTLKVALKIKSPKKDISHSLSLIGCQINLNTLILIMVSLGGFLGNMIYIASSFTSFVGAGQFKRTWTLWYFVKPFTAAGLAMALYFALRAGFFNSNTSSANINLYGIMIVAIVSGLFTDDATLKLKEIFETLFKPKDTRPDKLTNENNKD